MRELQLKFVSSGVTVRWLRILNVIEEEQTFTIVNLSERLDVSQRTLISDIGYLKLHFEKSVLFKFQSNRYTFEEVNRLLYQEEKQALLSDEVLFEIIGHIFYGEFESITDLAEHYNYSESTLRRFLILAQKALIDYQLEITFNPVMIIGSEESIRKFFFDFYYEGSPTPHTLRPPNDLHKLLVEELVEHLGNYELGTGCTVTAFYYLFYITMERSRQGFNISLPEHLKAIHYKEKDFQILFSLQNLIFKQYEVYLSKEEFCWIHYQVISRRTLDNAKQEKIFYKRFNKWPELASVTSNFLNRSGITQDNHEKLIPFLHSFFLTRKYNDKINPVLNKLLEEERKFVIANHSRELEHSIEFINEHQNIFNFSKFYLMDIAISLTLYSQILFHYYSPKRNILFLLEGDYFVIQYIRTQAQQILGSRHSINYLKIEELDEQQLKNQKFDVLVTNYSPYVSEYSLTKDYVLMNQVPNQKDWDRVLDKLNSLMNTSG